MQKELEAAAEIIKADASGGFNQYKETIYKMLEKVFTWLSTHQGPALIIALGILAIVIYLIVKSKIYRKKMETKVSSQKTEIGKKDALIKEQKNKLVALEKKLSDQQNVVSEALLGTLMNLTGFSLDQLRTFVKFLTETSGNPPQFEDTQAHSIPESQGVEEERDDSAGENDRNEKDTPEEAAAADKSDKNAPSTGAGDVTEADKSVKQ